MAKHPTDTRSDGATREPNAPPEEGERIAKFLARAGIASRRDAEKLVEAGRVSVNGAVQETLGRRVKIEDDVRVDGRRILAIEPTRLFLYHKPSGLVTTHRDPQGRPTVFERLPAHMPRLISVGRLDLTSEGLLLLTNDGALARRLELPASGYRRTYRARAFGRVSQAQLEQLAEGAEIDGVRYGPIDADLERQQGDNAWIQLSLHEGKNREVRRVLDSLGLRVNRLIRIAYGPFRLGLLGPGQMEEVEPRRLRALFGPSRERGAKKRAPPASQE